MTRIQELSDLLARVEKAAGPSFELDRAISLAFNGVGPKIPYVPPTYTASLDAAVALIERCLPGWCYKSGTCHVSDDAWVCPDWRNPAHSERLEREFGHLLVTGSEWDAGFDVDRRPPGNVPLALLEAMLMGLIAIAEASPARHKEE